MFKHIHFIHVFFVVLVLILPSEMYAAGNIEKMKLKKLEKTAHRIHEIEDPDEAFAESLRIIARLKQLEPDSENVHLHISTLYRVYTELIDQYRLDEAETIMRDDVIPMVVEFYEEESQAHIDALETFADLYRLQGNEAEAESSTVKATILKLKTIRPENVELLEQAYAMAFWFADARKTELAVKIQREVVAARRDTLKLTGESLERDLMELGSMLSTIDWNEAKTHCFESLALIEKRLGKNTRSYILELEKVALYCSLHGSASETEYLYRQVLELGETVFGNDYARRVEYVVALAQAVFFQGNFEEAEVILLSERDLLKRNDKDATADYILILNQLSDVYGHKSDFETAEKYLRNVLTIARSILDPNLEMYEFNLAATLLERGKFADAEFLLLRLEKSEDRVVAESAPSALAALYTGIGDYEKGYAYLRVAHQLALKNVGSSLQYARITLRLAVEEQLRLAYDQAESLMFEARDIFKKTAGKQSYYYAECLAKIAALYMTQGQFNKAEPIFEELLPLLRRNSWTSPGEISAGLLHLASLYTEQFRHAESLELTLEAQKISEKSTGKDSLEYAIASNHLARRLLSANDFEPAEKLLLEARGIVEKTAGTDSSEYHDVLGSTAWLKSEQRQYGEAQKLLLSIRDFYESKRGSREKSGLPSETKELAFTYMSQGDVARGLTLYREALDAAVAQFGWEHPTTLEIGKHTLWAVAWSQEEADSYGKELARKLIDAEAIFLNRVLLGMTDSTKSSMLRGFRDQDRVIYSCIQRFAEHDPAWARIGVEAGLKRKALMTDVLLSEERFGQQSDSLYWRILRGKLNRLREEYQAALYGSPENPKTNAAIKLLSSKISNTENELAQKTLEIASNTTSSTRIVRQVFDSLPPHSVLLEFVRFDRLEFDQWFETKKVDRKLLSTPHYICFIHAADTKAVHYVDIGEADPIDAAIKAWRAALQNHIRTGNFSGRTEAELAEYGAFLYEEIIDKIRDVSELPADSHLLISPDGDLNRIPFETFARVRDSQPIRYLAEEYSISYVTAGRELESWGSTGHAETKTALIIGNPDYDSMLDAESSSDTSSGSPAPLPPTPDKLALTAGKKGAWPDRWLPLPRFGSLVDSLAEQLTRFAIPFQRIEERNASEGQVKTTLKQAPNILAIATHGFYLPETSSPFLSEDSVSLFLSDDGQDSKANNIRTAWNDPLLRSGLVFAGVNTRLAEEGESTPLSQTNDGVLTALEVAGLDLRETELVSLIACETGLGELDSGVGVSGLRSAFQRSGAQTLQMSLFEIPVSESSSFSETFFDSWLKNDGTELAKARAHHQAQLEQLDAARKKRLPPPLKSGGHPFWWAGIVLIGNPN